MKIVKSFLLLVVINAGSSLFAGTDGGYSPDDIEISDEELECYTE